MATVKGPLFSLDARGQVGGAVVFGYWKGRNYVRRHAVPSNPQSVSQVGMRSMMRFLSQNWGSMSTGQQADWEDPAAQTNVSPFNAFVGYNMARWRNFLGPVLAYPATEDDTIPTVPTLVCTAGVRQITLTLGCTTLNDGWSCAIFRHTSTSFTPSWNNCIRVIKFWSGVEKTFIDTPLTAGVEMFYTQMLISEKGLKTAQATEDSETPT